MSEVSTFRLYLLRAMYLFIAVGLAIFELGPAILQPENLSRLDSVVISVLGGFALLAVVGIRYPLKMLPLLLWWTRRGSSRCLSMPRSCSRVSRTYGWTLVTGVKSGAEAG